MKRNAESIAVLTGDKGYDDQNLRRLAHDHGIRPLINIEDIEVGKEALESLGCELQGLYLTFGQYDAVGIIDAPDEETAAQFVLTLAKENDVDTETLRAFSEDETREILAGLPELWQQYLLNTFSTSSTR